MQDFKSATTGVAAKTMRNELNRMVQGVTDPAKRKVSCLSSRGGSSLPATFCLWTTAGSPQPTHR
jgi:hypothetical protein